MTTTTDPRLFLVEANYGQLVAQRIVEAPDWDAASEEAGIAEVLGRHGIYADVAEPVYDVTSLSGTWCRFTLHTGTEIVLRPVAVTPERVLGVDNVAYGTHALDHREIRRVEVLP